MQSRILRLAEVCQRVGLSRSSVYKFVGNADFPQPIPLGARAVGFIESEIEEWIQSRIDASRSSESADLGGRSA